MPRRKNGDGMIRKRGDGRWEGRIVVGYDEKGLPKTKNVLAKTKTECRDKLEILKASLVDTAEKATPDMTFGSYIDFWYHTFTEPKLKETTRKKYEAEIYGHIIPSIGNISLGELKHSDIEKFYAEQKKNGRQIRRNIYGEGLSNAMVRGIHARCKSALDRAAADGLIIRNPASDCALPPKKSREMKTLSRDEIRRFLIQAKYEGLYEMFLLDLSTGMRRGELLGLRWEDIDLDTGELHVRREVALAGGKVIVTTPKTRTSERVIKLPKSVVEVLREYKEKCNSEWMFPSPLDSTRPREPSACRKRLTHILERAGCKHVRFHDLRHTFATMALEGGMDIKTLSAVIGHSTAATTLNVYSHITSDMQKKAALCIDRATAKTAVSDTEMDGKDNDSDMTPSARPEPVFVPCRGRKRAPGTGCITRISPHSWQGKYTPRNSDGTRQMHVVYAKTEDECERKLSEMIAKVKSNSELQ